MEVHPADAVDKVIEVVGILNELSVSSEGQIIIMGLVWVRGIRGGDCLFHHAPHSLHVDDFVVLVLPQLDRIKLPFLVEVVKLGYGWK